MLTINKIGGVKGDDKSIEKYEKLSKIKKLSKSNKKLSKFKKPLALKYTFIFLKLTFTDIWIEFKIAYFFKKLIP